VIKPSASRSTRHTAMNDVRVGSFATRPKRAVLNASTTMPVTSVARRLMTRLAMYRKSMINTLAQVWFVALCAYKCHQHRL